MFEDFGQEQHWRSLWFLFEPCKTPKKITKTLAEIGESSKVAEVIAKEAATVAQIPPGKNIEAQVPPSETMSGR
jgi:hypothetical protein